jgi:hypothetical protein
MSEFVIATGGVGGYIDNLGLPLTRNCPKVMTSHVVSYEIR